MDLLLRIVFLHVLQATLEQRRLAVDLSDMVIKWEIQRIKEEQENGQEVWKLKLTTCIIMLDNREQSGCTEHVIMSQ